MATITRTTPGANTVTAPAASFTVHLWGGGGASAADAHGAGGGAACSTKAYTGQTIGATINYYLGQPGTGGALPTGDGTDGEASWFGTSGTQLADYGRGGLGDNTGGAGGLVSSCIGDSARFGGAGNDGDGTNTTQGGGAAGSSGDGANGIDGGGGGSGTYPGGPGGYPDFPVAGFTNPGGGASSDPGVDGYHGGGPQLIIEYTPPPAGNFSRPVFVSQAAKRASTF